MVFDINSALTDMTQDRDRYKSESEDTHAGCRTSLDDAQKALLASQQRETALLRRIDEEESRATKLLAQHQAKGKPLGPSAGGLFPPTPTRPTPGDGPFPESPRELGSGTGSGSTSSAAPYPPPSPATHLPAEYPVSPLGQKGGGKNPDAASSAASYPPSPAPQPQVGAFPNSPDGKNGKTERGAADNLPQYPASPSSAPQPPEGEYPASPPPKQKGGGYGGHGLFDKTPGQPVTTGDDGLPASENEADQCVLQ